MDEPKLGEIRYGKDMGYSTSQGRFIYSACEGCGKKRWVEYRKGKERDNKCMSCVKKGRTFKLSHADKNIIAKVGDIKTGGELGMKYKEQRYIYEKCPNCGNLRWVQIQSSGKYPKCHKCMNKGKFENKSGRWNGGRKINRQGYIEVRLLPNDPYIAMAKKSRYVCEHRLVVARALGRCLEKYEIIHHKDSNPSNNNLDNLELISDGKHNTMVEKVIKQKDRRILELENRIIELESRLQIGIDKS